MVNRSSFHCSDQNLIIRLSDHKHNKTFTNSLEFLYNISKVVKKGHLISHLSYPVNFEAFCRFTRKRILITSISSSNLIYRAFYIRIIPIANIIWLGIHKWILKLPPLDSDLEMACHGSTRQCIPKFTCVCLHTTQMRNRLSRSLQL